MAAGRPREFDYDDALEQAMRVFWTKGYEGTSMPDLTQAMGMNRPSIYAAFGNKEELFKKSLDKYYENAISHLEKCLNAPTVREAISAFFCGSATAFSCQEGPRGCFSVVGALVGSEGSKSVCAAARERREGIYIMLYERLKQAVKDGDLSKSADTQALARFFVTVLQGMSIQSSSGTSNEDLRKVADMAINILQHA